MKTTLFVLAFCFAWLLPASRSFASATQDDLSVARDAVFSFDFHTRADAKRFVSEVRTSGWRVELLPGEEHGLWQAGVTRLLTPTRDHIQRTEKRLSALAAKYDGKYAALD